ncbi:MAG: CHY zinc finger protein [Microbacteriaceae bacterium]
MSGPHVYGPVIDDQARCIHYGTAEDVVAIKFACCDRFYPCHLCHEQSESHPALQWPLARRAERAVLCGVCSRELTIAEYLMVENCPGCAARFNDGCRLHTGLYFSDR